MGNLWVDESGIEYCLIDVCHGDCLETARNMGVIGLGGEDLECVHRTSYTYWRNYMAKGKKGKGKGGGKGC